MRKFYNDYDRTFLADEFECDELIEKAADLYVQVEDIQIRTEIEELNDFIKSSQKSFGESGLPTEQTLKDFLKSHKE